MRPKIITALLLIVALVPLGAFGQQATIATPFHSLNDSFFEHIGTNWSFNWGNLSVRFGAPNIGAPQFGGYDPSAGLRTGWYSRGPDWDFGINLWAAQGSRRSLVSQVPSVTLMNGQTGIFSDTSQSPFVIGFIPVVGGFPAYGVLTPRMLPPPSMPIYQDLPGGLMAVPDAAPMGVPQQIRAMQQQVDARRGPGPHALPAPPAAVAPMESARAQAHQRRPAAAPQQPLAAPEGEVPRMRPGAGQAQRLVQPTSPPGLGQLRAAQQSSAGRPVPSVAEAARMHRLEQAAQQQKWQAMFERGLAAEQSGKTAVARIYYHTVAQRATGRLREEALRRLAALLEPEQR